MILFVICDLYEKKIRCHWLDLAHHTRVDLAMKQSCMHHRRRWCQATSHKERLLCMHTGQCQYACLHKENVSALTKPSCTTKVRITHMCACVHGTQQARNTGAARHKGWVQDTANNAKWKGKHSIFSTPPAPATVSHLRSRLEMYMEIGLLVGVLWSISCIKILLKKKNL